MVHMGWAAGRPDYMVSPNEGPFFGESYDQDHSSSAYVRAS